jgi:hypothetical protein
MIFLLALLGCTKSLELDTADTAAPADTADTGSMLYDCDGTGWDDCDGDGWPIEIGQWHEDEDCDDADPAINNDAEEVCDGADNDCNGLIDEYWDVDEAECPEPGQ